MSATSAAKPRFGNIERAADYSARSRATLYIWASKYPALFRKDGRSTIVDFAVLDSILDTLPAAQIKPPPSK